MLGVLNLFPLHYGTMSLATKTVYASDLKGLNNTKSFFFCDKWQAKATTDKVLFLLCTVYDILSSVYSSFHGSAKSSCSCEVAAQASIYHVTILW